MRIVRALVGTLLLIAIVYLAYLFVLNRDAGVLGFGASATTASARPRGGDVALSAAAMLAGLLFGALYQQLAHKSGNVNFLEEVKTVITGASFFRSLLVAPLVFGGVYATSNTQPDLIVALIFAFQNGFFCEAVFRQKHGSRQN